MDDPSINMEQSAQQRRDAILAQVIDKSRVSVTALAEQFNVSQATVRRDLKTLADSRQVRLVHGGAETARISDFSFHAKARRNQDAKRVIGKLAAELIGDDEQIFLDSGTTCFEVAALLKRQRSLTVIVSSARLALELPDAPGINIITLGGRYRPDRMDTIGPLATATLDQLRGYTALIGADGLDMEFGPSASDMDSAFLHRQVIQHAARTWLLVDHSKFATSSMFKIADWPTVQRVITDQPPPQEWTEFLTTRGIEVTCPEATTEPTM